MTLRAGVAGLGVMGRNHARVLGELEGVDLVGVADPEGDKFGVADDAAVVRSLDELIDLDIDLCVVAAPTADHHGLALQLADAGIHTLVEKPLAASVSAATEIADAFESAGVVGCVGHIERFNPALQQLRARLEQGDAGQIFQVATRRVGPFPDRVRDVGVVKDLATHDIDLTAWVVGSPFASVAARCTHQTGREHEDLVAITGQLVDGTVTNHLINWLSPLKERLTMVTGTKGAFIADTLTGDLTWYANAVVPTEWSPLSVLRGVAEGDMTRFAFPKPEPLRVELTAFRDAVLDLSTDVVTMGEGLEVVRVAEAVLASAASGDFSPV